MTANPTRQSGGTARRVPMAVYVGLPYLLLAGSTVVAWFDLPGQSTSHLLLTVWLVALTAVWLLWPVVTFPVSPVRNGSILVFYAGLLVLTAALVTQNSAFGLFTTVAYNYALILLSPRLIVWAFAATALATTFAQGYLRNPLTPYGVLASVALPLLFVGWYVSRQSERRNDMINELEAANQRLAETLEENVGLHAQLINQAREAGVLDERHRMAREIHDTIAQGLTGIITQLQAADHAAERSDTWRRHLHNAARLARESLSEARRSVRAMRPELLETTPLPEALSTIVSGWSEINPITAEMTTTGNVITLHPEVDMALLRIAQEALANVAKHSGASRVRLTLSFFDDVVTLDVRDDGRGFDPQAPGNTIRPDGGFGLSGMRQRVARLAGTLEIESEPGGGCALSASVPAVPAGQTLAPADH